MITGQKGVKYGLEVRKPPGAPLWLYGFNLTSDYGVAPVRVAAMSANDTCRLVSGRAAGTGREHMIVIASERPLPTLERLGQPGLRGPAPADPLERIIWEADAGLRTRGVPIEVGTWGVRRVTYLIEPKP